MTLKRINIGAGMLFALSILVYTGTHARQAGKNISETKNKVTRMYIGPKLENCDGAQPMKCMMIRKSPQGQWEYFYAPIEGFSYKEGFNYVLLVKEVPVKNPPADASAKRFVMVRLVSKKKA